MWELLPWRRPQQRVLVLCTENICRSPLAEGGLRWRLQSLGLGRVVAVGSAGTRVSRAGRQPDKRARELAVAAGYSLKGIRSRQLTASLLQPVDMVLAMEQRHLDDLYAICPDWPGQAQLLSAYHPGVSREREITDPYYLSRQAFEDIHQLMEQCLDGVAAHLAEVQQL